MQDLKLTKHWFSSFQWVPLQEGMNEICATFRPPITIFLMAGALTRKPTFCTCKNKGAVEELYYPFRGNKGTDQLHSNCVWIVQFIYILNPNSVLVQFGLCPTCSKTTLLDFLMKWLIFTCSIKNNPKS